MARRTKSGWGFDEYLWQRSAQWLREHAKNPLAPTEEEWLQSRTFDAKRLKQYALEESNYNPNLVYDYFKRINPTWNIDRTNSAWKGTPTPYTRPVTTLDIETDDLGRPITISAVKTAFNVRTGKMEVIDTFQRFYKARDVNLRDTEITHGLTRDILNKLREQQGASYPWTYQGWGPSKGKEQQALRDFIGKSIIVGQNIHDFDLPKLFGVEAKNIKNQVVDTLMAARNIWGDTGRNSLDQIFQRVFGKSMEDAGLPHHDSMSDTIATAMIYHAMATSNTPTGDALRKILKHGDINLAPVDLGIDEDIGGSQLVRSPYWKYALQDVRLYIDRYGKTGADYMAHTNHDISEEEYMGTVIGTEMHETGPKKQLEGKVDPNAAGGEDTPLMINALASSINKLSDWLQTVQESAVDIKGFGSSLSQYRKAQYIQLLARAEYDNAGEGIPGNMKKVARGLGIVDKDYETFRVAATAIKESKEYSDAYKELRQYTRKGLGNTDFVKALRASLADTWGDWGPEKLKALERDREYAAEMDFRKKDHFLRGQLRHGRITEDQYNDLSGLEGSYEDLVDATDELIKKNQQLMNVYEAMGKIKMYDPNQYLNSARGQASSILGAAKGVVPSFILNPLSRLTDASFNYQQGKLTGFNAVSRTWNSGIGQAVTGILGAAMGVPGIAAGTAITGGVNAISQVVGNIGQYRMEKAGFAIQNNLNTLGAIFSWVSAPFQLLSKATKLLIGNFSGLSLTLNKLMTGGLNEMSTMGNPLTELTGVNYAAYQGTTMMDAASLFNRGTMNAAYESFANQQRAFYTTGEVNQSRLIASSLLGVYSDVYVPGTDSESQYNGMVNKLLRNMKGRSADEQARMMYLASQIDSSLPGLLRTANMLGVEDISQLTDPRKRGMYFRSISDAEERNFRWDQYEFGAARTQLGNTKMRFADKLWNSIGKDLYNGFNRLADSALTGNWDAAVAEASDMWEKFKTKFVTVWDGIKKVISGEGGDTNWGSKFIGVFAKVGIMALEVVRTISNAWGQLIGIVLDKAQGLVSYLSTISIKPHIGADGRISFEVQSIKDRMAVSDKERIGTPVMMEGRQAYDRNGNPIWTPNGSYAELARQLFPEMSETQLSKLTVGDLRKKLLNMQGTWADPEGNAGRVLTLGRSEYVPDSPEAIEHLLGMAKLSGRELDAAAFASGMVPGFRKRNIVYTEEGLGDSVRDFHAQATAEVLNPLIDAAQESLGAAAQKLELNIKINDKEAARVMVEDGKATISKMTNMLSNLIYKDASIDIARQG